MDGLGGIRYGEAIGSAAARHGLDARLLAAVAAQESGGPSSDSGSNVVGDGGHGRGLFQIDDRYHAFARSPAAMDPARNADYAAGLLGGLLRRFGGSVRAALSAYNAGSPSATGTVTAWPDGSRLGYADSVLRHLARIDARDSLLADAGGGTAYGSGPAALAPAPQLPPFTAQNQPYRSYASELQSGGGDVAAQTDRRNASDLDPSDALTASDDASALGSGDGFSAVD